MLTTVLDLFGITCLAVFAWFVWPPLPLGVVAVAALMVSRQLVARKGAEE